MPQYLNKDGNFFPLGEVAVRLIGTLPAGLYGTQKTIEDEYFLHPLKKFELGTPHGDVVKRANRIFNTFMNRESSTGVLLSGEKGSGKTFLAKYLALMAIDRGLPVILISSCFKDEKFNHFVQDISQPCVFIFDEFEKVYSDKNEQAALLSLLDGTYQAQKLFILTANDCWNLERNLINRPGRLFYHLEYKSVSPEFIQEYCEKKLHKLENVDGILRLAKVIDCFNFDMLSSLVEEMNRYDETAQEASEYMNLQVSEFNSHFSYELFIDGKLIERDSEYGSPLRGWEWDGEVDDESDSFRCDVRQCVSIQGDERIFNGVTDNGRQYVLKTLPHSNGISMKELIRAF